MGRGLETVAASLKTVEITIKTVKTVESEKENISIHFIFKLSLSLFLATSRV